MGQMKELVIEMEEHIAGVIDEQAENENVTSFPAYKQIVLNAYAAEPLLCHTPIDYVEEVAYELFLDFVKFFQKKG
jgi:hypothetical protein